MLSILRSLIYRTEVVDLEVPEPLDCIRCGGEHTVRLLLLYEYRAGVGVFGVVGRHCYSLVCDVCGASRKVSKWEAQIRQTRQVRLPLTKRYGIPLLIGLLAILGVTYFVLSRG